MKNILKLSFLLTAAILITSCENDDDEATFVQPNYLAGKWVPVEMGTLDDENILNYFPYENDAECDADFLQLNEDMTYTYSDSEYNGATCDATVIEGDYRRENKVLFLTTLEDVDGVPTEFETSRNLISLTYDTMEISYTDETTGDVTFIKLEKQNP
ncbi:hypothetical protein ABGT15_13835 [Flavobacterium enshiense]|uniref:hypothetical protein n=1 Tax=Flavobacterium enshiense TaxID=1341165 RepID=UPI00345CB42E